MKGCVNSVLKCCDNKNFKTCPASKGAKWQITETTADFQRLQQKLPVAESRPDQIFYIYQVSMNLICNTARPWDTQFLGYSPEQLICHETALYEFRI